MTTKGEPESVRARSMAQRVYEAYPASTSMCEDAFDRSLWQPLHRCPECMLQGSAYFAHWKVFLSCKRILFYFFHGWVSHDKEKKECGERPSCQFYERMC